MIEITSVSLNQGVVNILAIDVSEENLQRLERTRDDGFEQEVEFVFDTHQKEHFLYLNRWLRKQKATKGCSTWGGGSFTFHPGNNHNNFSKIQELGVDPGSLFLQFL